MSCKLVRRHMGALVDGELDPATQIEFERHVEACPGCQEHLAFETSFRQQTRDALGAVRAPEHLWRRALHRLDEIDSAKVEHAPLIEVRPMQWRQSWPIAAAAAAVLIVGAVVGLPEHNEYQSAGMLEDVVNLHSQALPADVRAEAAPGRLPLFSGQDPFPGEACGVRGA